MISQERVHEILMDCLYRDEEIAAANGKPPEGFVEVHSVLVHLGLHPKRLENHRKEVREMLMNLPDEFMASKGGGWTFLNACNTKDGVQWGEHRDMDELFALGIGLGYAKFTMPREMWSVLPGGMPYITIDDNKE